MVATISTGPEPAVAAIPAHRDDDAHRVADDGCGRHTVGDVPGERPDQASQLVDAEPVIRRICRSSLGYWDGDDAAQEALTYVWKASRRPDFDDRGTLVPYGVAAARGQVKTGYGWRDRRPVPVGEQVEHGHQFADTDAAGPDEAAERAETAAAARERVAALMDQLTPRQRQAVTECALRERGTDEVAAELGLTPSSVRSSQVRGMARLRELCGTRSTNPLSAGRSSVQEYQRRRQDWERARVERERVEGRVIPRRASRHRAAHVAAGRLPTDTGAATPAEHGEPVAGEPDAVARAAAAVARTRRQVAEDLAGDEQDTRRGQLAAWHHADHGRNDHDQDQDHDQYGRYQVAGDECGGAA